MASSTPLKDLEEKFFHCPVCLELFQDPKLLPCLHRYCSKCLLSVVNASHDGTIECPMCRKQCDVPDNGMDGFKTDFHTKNVVEFLQLQKEFENDKLKKCVSCSKDKNASAYCFKCKDFLCEQCYDVHISSKMFTDHKPRTLKLDEVDDGNITLEKLATLAEDPRCRTHLEENAKLCCRTCTNEPICVICSFGKHKGHDLDEITELAKTERELLEPKIAELEKLKSKLYELPRNVEATKQKLNENVAKKTDILIQQHKHQVNEIKRKLEEHMNEIEQGLADIEKRRKDEEQKTNIKYEKEMNELNEKYDEIRKTTERKYNRECQHFKDSCEKNENELSRKLESLSITFMDLTESKDFLTESYKKELAKISENCDQVIERYENLTAIASSVLAAKDEWAQVQCIPDIRAACEPLIEEMKKEYPQLDSLSDIYIRDMPNVVVNVTISEREPSVAHIEALKRMGWSIDGIASSGNGDIVISGGKLLSEYSHITVVDRKGRIQRQHKITREKKSLLPPFRYCCYISDFKVATACAPDEIGIYDVHDGLYNRKYISDVTPEWSPVRLVWSMTIDPVTNHIIVGTDSRFVYVFDDQLNYIRTIKLPDIIKSVDDITVHAGALLVCHSEKAFAVTMEGPESKLMYEFNKPELPGFNMGPRRVCVDKNDFIYMLWGGHFPDRGLTLVHYTQNGRHLLTTRKVDEDATYLTTVEVDGSEKLLIATNTSGKIYEYNITVT